MSIYGQGTVSPVDPLDLEMRDSHNFKYYNKTLCVVAYLLMFAPEELQEHQSWVWRSPVALQNESTFIYYFNLE